ncbi:DUF1080 domain-containing protein [Lutibacter sp. HS1-25]|uniref:3-keto-disaccharide hydrolase n=1 Tax=Lutibacter sp. HS1-25 TaxID=2485000 RepID=UPI00101215B6|nr:DUF1080 domain-containing protein [Lutibacter sp. HS1-25]RXP62719.1 DUF1080 domain-containing protein [Lutibacter sp. HS1-25]
MRSLKKIIFVFLIIVTSSCKDKVETAINVSNDLTEDIIDFKGIPLFNGENLDTWYLVVKDSSFSGEKEDLFAIEDGTIHVYPTQEHNSIQTYAGLMTNKVYSNYKLTLQYKWGVKKFAPRDNFVRDAGVIFHQFGPDVIWPTGVECQIQEGDTGDIWAIGAKVTSKVSRVIRNYDPNGELVTRGTPKEKFQRFHRSYDWEIPGWNTLEIEVKGDCAKYTLNGHVVNEVIDMQKYNEELGIYEPLTSGKILIQAEGAELYYRNIFIEEF